MASGRIEAETCGVGASDGVDGRQPQQVRFVDLTRVGRGEETTRKEKEMRVGCTDECMIGSIDERMGR